MFASLSRFPWLVLSSCESFPLFKDEVPHSHIYLLLILRATCTKGQIDKMLKERDVSTHFLYIHNLIIKPNMFFRHTKNISKRENTGPTRVTSSISLYICYIATSQYNFLQLSLSSLFVSLKKPESEDI